MQYTNTAYDDFEHFIDYGYDIFVQWLNPGYSDAAAYSDDSSLVSRLLHSGATLHVRDGRLPPEQRICEMRQYILGWATYRNLLHTDFQC